MTLKAFYTLLIKQIRAKWGRLILASGGIMIGVWAITLTNGLSLGLNQTIVDAINSQQLAKEISVNKLEGKINFQEIPNFKSISQEEINNIKEIPGVNAISPRDYLSFFIKDTENSAYKCVEENINIQEAQLVLAQSFVPNQESTKTDSETNTLPPELQAFTSKCKEATSISNVYKNFYETHKSKWIGSTNAPKRGQIVSCFECGGLKIGEHLGAKTPEELVGKKILIELSQSPIISQEGEARSVLELTGGGRNQIKNTSAVEMEIISVIDDRESVGFSLTGSNQNNFFLDFSYYLDAIKLSDSDIPLDQIGFFEAVLVLDDYTYMDSVLDKLTEDGFYATSIAKIIITGIDSIFAVQRVVLFAFGIIILIASVFGIIAIMTISVLERRKEIGILKAMGSQDRDIFWLFLAESAFLGILGWLLGTVLYYICSIAINQGFLWFLNNEPSWKENLGAFNISDFAPIAPWWLLLSTLIISIFFTSLSGLFPAINAARQNPVDVLRSE